jgi:hypothetical protein
MALSMGKVVVGLRIFWAVVGREGRSTDDRMRCVTKFVEGGFSSNMAAFLVNQTFQQMVAGSEGKRLLS